MENLFAPLFFISLIFLVIGLFKPSASLFWLKSNPTRKKSTLFYFGLIILSFVLFVFTSDRNRSNKLADKVNVDTSLSINSSKQEVTTNSNVATIEKIDSKIESRKDGEYNKMTIFYVDSSITSNELVVFCKSNKDEYSSSYLNILVFFKSKSAARFPDNPLSALFVEENDLIMIKAIYTFNRFNGYSKLDYYNNNANSSLPQSIDI
mgnify:CR=1 FL=1